MAELDYAFLADHAQVEGGKLSAIGASFTHATSAPNGNIFVLSVAGRVRLVEGEAPPILGITLRGPEGAFEVNTEVQLVVGPEARPYDGKIGVLFASGLAVPVIHGLYEVLLSLDDRHVRRLAFDIAVQD